MKSGTLNLRKARTALRALVEDALLEASGPTEDTDHTDDTQAQPRRLELSSCDAELIVQADRERLTTLLSVLCRELLRHAPSGAAVQVSLERQGPNARIVVSEPGAGLAPRSLEEIFASFAAGSARAGLDLAQELLQGHGGAIHTERQGSGCRFVVTLPLVKRVRQRRDPTPAPRVPDFKGALRVLVVDDNSDAAMALGMLLDASRCVVETAFSGRSALEKARALQPDVVLCDIGLPDLSGFDVAAALRVDERCRKAMLVAVTGFRHDDVAGRVRQSGFDLHLLKPVDPDVLFDVLAGARKALLGRL